MILNILVLIILVLLLVKNLFIYEKNYYSARYTMMKFTFWKYIILGSIIASALFSGVVYSEAKTSQGIENITAGFIYIGPVGDYGWTNAHDGGRVIVDDKYDWLDTVFVEGVAEDSAALKAAVDTMVSTSDPDVIFTTSFGYMDGTLALATEDYPDKIFFHASGFKRAPNMGTYFADFYQIYYLNGLMAGAITDSNKVGYVGAFPIPEVVRHINAFALGTAEVNPSATVDVIWLNSWFDPTQAKAAANTLIADGVDVLAFTEDTPAVLQAAEENEGVYGFSHYSPMQSYAPTSSISGQLVHWEILYDEILLGVHDGTYTNTNLDDVDFLYFLNDDAVELGGEFGVAINPLFEDELKAKMVTDDGVAISVFDLINKRLDQMDKPYADAYDPFTGPIKSQDGTVKLADGVRATIPELFATMDWFVENINGNDPAGNAVSRDTTAAPVDANSAIVFPILIAAIFAIRRRRRN